jgi:hypothetical protein
LSGLDRVHRVAVRRGVFGKSRPWLALAITTWGMRFARRAMRRDAIVLRETLAPGESLVISHSTETYERRRKRSR